MLMYAPPCAPSRIIEPQKRFLQAMQARGVSKSVWLDDRKLLLDVQMAYDAKALQLNIFDEKTLSKKHDELVSAEASQLVVPATDSSPSRLEEARVC